VRHTLASFLTVLLLAFAVLAGGPAEVAAQTAPAFAQQLPGWNRTMDAAEIRLRGRLDSADIEALRTQLARVRDEAGQARGEAEGQLQTQRQLLDALGPAPAEGQPPEAPQVAEQRKRLQQAVGTFDGQIKQAELTAARAQQLMDGLQQAQRSLLTAEWGVRDVSPLSPRAWTAAVPEFLGHLGALAAAPTRWIEEAALGDRWPAAIGVVLLAGLGAAVIAFPLRLALQRRWGWGAAIAEPSLGRRLTATLVEAFTQSFLSVIALATMWAALLWQGLLVGAMQVPLEAGLAAGGAFLAAVGIARATLAPDRPAWRLSPFTDEAARSLHRALRTFAGVVAAVYAMQAVAESYSPSRQLDIIYTYGGLVAISLALQGLLRRRNWQTRDAVLPEGAAAAEPRRRVPVFGLVWLATNLTMLAGLGFGAFGYLAFANYLVTNIWTTLGFGALYMLGRGLIHEALPLALSNERRGVARLRSQLGLGEDSLKSVVFWLSLIAETALSLVVGLLILLSWGVPWSDVAAVGGQALSGFRIGGFTFSVLDFLAAVVVFFAVLAVVRVFQRFIEQRVLPQTRLDPGVRDSLKAGIGYIGLALAAAIAVPVMGLDLTNLALIAGALSVGIGFGLQAIVNNFVSGIILLVERPIKVGDWVVVGAVEGTVRKINVRATEIQTFQKATVIIPNSDILSAAVTNWTHKDREARIDVPVGVAYGTDPEKVREVLLGIACGHPLVAHHPAPFIVFKTFGASSLDFELRCFVDNLDNMLKVKTDLMFQVVRRFREEGLEIPFAQNDVSLKDIDRIERALYALGGMVPPAVAPAPGVPNLEPANLALAEEEDGDADGDAGGIGKAAG